MATLTGSFYSSSASTGTGSGSGRAAGTRVSLIGVNGTGANIYNLAGGATTTATPGAAASGFDDTVGHCVLVQTGAVNGNIAGISTTSQDETRGNNDPDLTVLCDMPSSLAAIRFWCGLASGAVGASDSPAVHLAAFRYSTGASDSAFMYCTKNGTTLTANSTGVTPATSTTYLFRVALSSNGTRADFYINNNYVGTQTLTMPTATTNLGIYCHWTTLAASNLVCAFRTAEVRQSVYP